jgi:RNA recognition motif-containing protein
LSAIGPAPLARRPAKDRHLRNLRDQEAAQPRQVGIFFCEHSEVTKLYVGNLPFTATEDSVRALFAPHGTVEKISLINDRDTGRPRGFGFVEMSNADASRAMQALNGQDFDGRALKINEAQDRAAGGGGGRGPRRY